MVKIEGLPPIDNTPAEESPIMKFFKYDHLPPNLQGVSKAFADLAFAIRVSVPNNAEKSTALRKLLEAKDCAVRAVL